MKLISDNNIDEYEFVTYVTYLRENSASYDSDSYILSTSNIIIDFFKPDHEKKPSRIKKITKTDRISSKEFKNMINGVIDSLKKKVQKATHDFIFTDGENQLAYQYNTKFQILRAPDDCEKPPTEFGRFPALLRYVYEGHPDDSIIDNFRRFRNSNEIKLLFNVLHETNIYWYEPNMPYCDWVFGGLCNCDRKKPHYCQKGYFCDSKKIEELNKKHPDSLYPLNEYQDFEPKSHDKSHHLVFDAFYKLDENERTKVLRACYWYRTAHRAKDISESLAYQSYINAVESLIEKVKDKGSSCNECGQKVVEKSISDHFKEIVEKYNPVDEGTNVKKYYGIRSKITHGDKLFFKDEISFRWGLSSKEIHEFDDMEESARISRNVIVGFLLEKGNTGQ